jgi:Arc/MetJ-type ribon-helix-helix transcriptional regulator
MSLDDLLSYEEEPRPRMRSGAARRILLAVITTVVMAWFVWFMLRVLGIGAPFILIAGAIVVLAALREILVSVSPPELPDTLRHIPASTRAVRESTSDGIRDAVRKWEAQLDWTHQDLSRFRQIVQPAMAGLVDERLRIAHGIDMRAEPAKAQRVVDPQLWSFIHDQIRRNPTPQEIAVLVANMEAL